MAKYRVIVTARSFGNADSKAIDLLQDNDCEVVKTGADQLGLELPKADAVIAGLEVYNQTLIEAADKLKVISRYGVGYDKVDVESANRKGIKVTITPGANGDSVADLAVALMLNCARSVNHLDNSIKQKINDRPLGMEMWEKTLCVIGTGRIGKSVAKRCSGFHMNILGYDTYQDEEFVHSCGGRYVDFDEILKEADFITIHAPLTPNTANMFSFEQFKKMKRTAIIVNTARGGIIDEDALYKALKDGEIFAAGLDVTLQDPPFDSPLTTLPNCIITPHAGAATAEASSKMSLMAAQNVLDVLNSGSCKYEISL